MRKSIAVSEIEIDTSTLEFRKDTAHREILSTFAIKKETPNRSSLGKKNRYNLK